MSNLKVMVYGVVPQSAGRFEAILYFRNPQKAMFTKEGDSIKNGGLLFPIVSIAGTILADGGKVILQGSGTAPIQDSDHVSELIPLIPNPDLVPTHQTVGQILSSTVKSPKEFSFSVTATWNDSAQANMIAVGDKILDFAGRDYTIIEIPEPGSYVVEEVARNGDKPLTGIASAYSATPGGYFQGKHTTDPASQEASNRDNLRIDRRLKAVEGVAGKTYVNIQPAEAPDGVITDFTLPDGLKFMADSLQAFVNGLATDTTEVGDNGFTLSLDWIPDETDSVRVTFVEKTIPLV